MPAVSHLPMMPHCEVVGAVRLLSGLPWSRLFSRLSKTWSLSLPSHGKCSGLQPAWGPPNELAPVTPRLSCTGLPRALLAVPAPRAHHWLGLSLCLQKFTGPFLQTCSQMGWDHPVPLHLCFLLRGNAWLESLINLMRLLLVCSFCLPRSLWMAALTWLYVPAIWNHLQTWDQNYLSPPPDHWQRYQMRQGPAWTLILLHLLLVYRQCRSH